jgi:hypothetical protein
MLVRMRLLRRLEFLSWKCVEKDIPMGARSRTSIGAARTLISSSASHAV